MTITTFTITPNQIRGDQLADEILQATGIDILGRYSFYPPSEVHISGGDVAEARDEIQAVIDAHVPDPLYFPEDVERERRQQADVDIAAIPGWATWTAQEAQDWIDANVTSLASARTALKAMARMLVALRNKTWPSLEGS
jgi:predicted RNase H-like HicB family nuclease